MRTIEQIIAKNIELKLDELNMNQDELARRSKLSRQTINRIINNQVSSIRENTRLSIAKALGVSREELERNWMNAAEFVGTRPEPSDLELDNRALRDRILKLEAQIEGIDPKYLKALKEHPEKHSSFEALFDLDEEKTETKKKSRSR